LFSFILIFHGKILSEKRVTDLDGFIETGYEKSFYMKKIYKCNVGGYHAFIISFN